MRYKATFAIGLAAGYVLGSRAGRQRYEQIKRMSRTVTKNPTVKHTAEVVQAQALHLSNQARKTVSQKAGSVGHDLVGKVTSRFGNHEINLESEHSYANGSMT